MADWPIRQRHASARSGTRNFPSCREGQSGAVQLLLLFFFLGFLDDGRGRNRVVVFKTQ